MKGKVVTIILFLLLIISICTLIYFQDNKSKVENNNQAIQKQINNLNKNSKEIDTDNEKSNLKINELTETHKDKVKEYNIWMNLKKTLTEALES